MILKDFLLPKDRREQDGTNFLQHDIKACGPIGLILKSVIWHGLKIVDRFNIWQEKKEPICIFDTPFHNPDPKLRLLREIDKQASKIDCKRTSEEKGILRTHIIGGGMAKHDIARYNDDVGDTCDYCLNEFSTAAPHYMGVPLLLRN